MISYLVRRVLVLIPVLFGVSLLVFLIFFLTPGDPVRGMLGEAGQGISAEEIERIRSQLGLDRPWYVQYADYIAGVFQGDFGRSFQGDRPVFPELLARFPQTLALTLFGLVLALAIGIPAGVLTASRPNSLVDATVTFLVLLGVSIPVFWLGIMLMHLFALEWRLLPPSGWGTLRHVILPGVTVALASIAFVARMTRSAMRDELREDYVRTARAKGLSERRVLVRHALRGALIPVVTTIGLQFGALMGGAVIVETIFSLPGLGRYIVSGIQARDLPVIQGSILWVALSYNLINLAIDVIYVAIDPRIRYD